jgi:protein SCO1/2
MKLNEKRSLSLELVFFISLITIVIVHRIILNEKELPIYNPSDLNPELVDSSMLSINKGHTVSDFNLINQNGAVITQNDYANKIFVTDFFFTRCPSICPVMTNNMEKLQDVFLKDDRVKLLSISVTPEMDSIPILRNYAEKNGAIASKWNITTGYKKHIYELARKSFFAVNDIGDGGLQDFIHTPNFVLVDTKKRIRGIYDGTQDDEIERLIVDMKSILD